MLDLKATIDNFNIFNNFRDTRKCSKICPKRVYYTVTLSTSSQNFSSNYANIFNSFQEPLKLEHTQKTQPLTCKRKK